MAEPNNDTGLQRRAEMLARLLQSEAELVDLRRALLAEDYGDVLNRARYLATQMTKIADHASTFC